jgi:hypothetical protein
MNKFLLAREIFETQALVTKYPPRLQNSNKKLVYSIACPNGTKHGGKLVVSRWKLFQEPSIFSLHRLGSLALFILPLRPKIENAKHFYQYKPSSDPKEVEWYVNFADSSLFFAYGTALFAQDEMQVAEHPSLGSLREKLQANKQDPSNHLIPGIIVSRWLGPNLVRVTRENSKGTPILIEGIERRCSIATGEFPSDSFC